MDFPGGTSSASASSETSALHGGPHTPILIPSSAEQEKQDVEEGLSQKFTNLKSNLAGDHVGTVNQRHASVAAVAPKSEDPQREKMTVPITSDGDRRCRCRMSECIKLLCDCFAAGTFCAEHCSCQGCKNRPEYEDIIKDAKIQIESRHPLAFAPMVEQQHIPSHDTVKVGCYSGYENPSGKRRDDPIKLGNAKRFRKVENLSDLMSAESCDMQHRSPLQSSDQLGRMDRQSLTAFSQFTPSPPINPNCSASMTGTSWKSSSIDLNRGTGTSWNWAHAPQGQGQVSHGNSGPPTTTGSMTMPARIGLTEEDSNDSGSE